MPFLPIEFIKSLKNDSIGRWIFYVTGLFAAVTVAVNYKLSLPEALLGTIGIVALIFLILAFAALSSSENKSLKIIGIFISGSLSLIFVLSISYLACSVLTGWPKPFNVIVSYVTIPNSSAPGDLGYALVKIDRDSYFWKQGIYWYETHDLNSTCPHPENVMREISCKDMSGYRCLRDEDRQITLRIPLDFPKSEPQPLEWYDGHSWQHIIDVAPEVTLPPPLKRG